MTAEGTVAFWSKDKVGQIVFDRPPANAYDLNFHQQFNAAIESADKCEDTRVVIVMSAVPRFFCAGADVKAFAANSTSENKRMVESARSALARIESSSKPFIALLEGHTLGGGLEIAMACDMRFGTEGDFKLGLPEARLGLLPGNGGSQRLPRIVGTSQAMRLLTSGESVDPQEALRIGLIDRLYPADDARAQTGEFAQRIAESAPLAVAAAKRAVNEGLQMSLEDGLALESRLVDALYDTEDASEGFDAAAGKRTPDYKGK